VEIVENNQWKMYTLMELGGQTLIDYVYQKFQTEGITQKLLIDVIKGAGRALNQFHRRQNYLTLF